MKGILLIGFFLCLLVSVHGAFAQGYKNPQSGDITIEQTETKKDTYPATQNATIDFFRNMDQRVQALSQGRGAGAATLSEDSLNYLTGVYLYCSINSGTCPLIIESILEADIINSKLSNNADCPLMKKFWTLWVKNGMEQRFSYSIKTSFMNDVQNFNTKIRPAFIRCQDTVKDKIAGATSNDAYFKERYKKDSRPSILAAKTVTLLETIKQKVPNVFVATGAIKN